MYSLIKPLLFRLNAETAHNITMRLLDFAHAIGILDLIVPRPVGRPCEVMGIRFANRVGLAAGLDKNGDHIDALAECGFGFIEVGTVTPRPQAGNARPRMFRLAENRAIINRMGFNNKGVDHLVEQVSQHDSKAIIGINIGKNKDTPNDRALDDYLACMRKAFLQADYIAVNISSPNTPGLRELQQADELRALLQGLMAERDLLAATHARQVPLAVKIAPDLDDQQLADMVAVFRDCRIDGIIATNTTNDHRAVAGHIHAEEQGGLSGEPLRERASEVLAKVIELVEGEIPVISVGGIMTPADAARRIEMGAALVQLYSGFIYAGPDLVNDAITATNSD